MPISRILNTHICFSLRRLLARAASGAGLIPTSTILLVVGTTPTRRRSFCDAPLRGGKIRPMAAQPMRARLIGDRILQPDVLRTYRQDWPLRSDSTRMISLG